MIDWLHGVLVLAGIAVLALALLFARASAAHAMFPKQRYNRVVAYIAAWVAIAVALGVFWIGMRF
jgi:hypothetical protein